MKILNLSSISIVLLAGSYQTAEASTNAVPREAQFRFGVTISSCVMLRREGWLHVRIEQIKNYKDGSWVWFKLTNNAPCRLYICPFFVKTPLRTLELTNKLNQQCSLSTSSKRRQFVDYENYFTLEPGLSIRFRLQISPDGKPLEIIGRKEGENPPLAVSKFYYSVRQKCTVFTLLSSEHEKSKSFIALGSGNVEVVWIDRPTPGDLYESRLIGDRN